MRKKSWDGTLIVVAPDSPRVAKFRFTRVALVILALAFVMSFLFVVILDHLFSPVPATDLDRSRLAAENQQLKLRNLNISTGAAKVEASVDRAEQQARHIQELLDSANSTEPTQ